MEKFGIRNKRKIYNKGFSLIEILVAIALLAVVITPVLNSFITSARVNRNARKLMIATDVCQSVMEGFAGKTYEDIETAIDANTGVGFSGVGAFSSINGDYYNTSGNNISANNVVGGLSSTIDGIFTSKVNSSSNVGSGTMQQTRVNSEVADRFGLRCLLEVDAGNALYDKIMIYHKNDIASYFYYRGIESEGYKFDCIVSVVPAANADSDIYYPYSVVCSVYDTITNTVDVTVIKNGQKLPLMVMDTGIRNLDGK